MTKASTAAEPIQDLLWYLGSDDGGNTWRELKLGERANLYYAKFGPPHHYSDEARKEWEASAPQTLEEAIAAARERHV